MRTFPFTGGALLLAALCAASGVQADIYKYVDKYGRVTLTDRPKNDQYKLLVKTWKGWEEAKSKIALEDFRKNRKRHTPTIDKAAREYDLPAPLLHAVVTAESAYDAEAVSRAGAVGLMQLMPETARRYGVQNRRNPVANLHGGIRYLRDLLHMFDNDLSLALAAYNAGESAVVRYDNSIPPFKETQNYVSTVIEYYRKYREPDS